ncbi:MAG: adenylosuccinate lyase [Paludibacteraceae bacterium]|nr:adenylosuccinate lyase [Paludibacteraceae bacterium]MBP8966082.1 adenylosuccinate lyase [Paludibacteraceae bacterium]OPZ03299.1 MAG: Adenylosuccinate lyase [Bacteroidetes bacterium ADurb.BinA395]HOF98426.1 adenylosuccinate lyase [Paludibacteraceae bacterium]
MNLSPLTAISPVDGRYRSKTEKYAEYFSEFALIRFRVMVEVEYFISLCEIPLKQLQLVPKDCFDKLRAVYIHFQESDAEKIKEIEQTTNHDVKAVEYFLKQQFDLLGLSDYKEFIHFGLTSQDINNTAVPVSIKKALEDVYYPEMENLLKKMRELAEEWKDIPMLARTHGQPASPTRLGKEIMVFVYRLDKQLSLLRAVPISGKFGGATGNFNAHSVAYPLVEWKNFADKFLAEKLGIQREEWTTQISNYDHLAALLDSLKRIDTILIDFCRDVWTYVSMEYFKQKIKPGEVGSSAMPHKVNPIDFENAEGNLGMANAVLDFLSAKLPISRLQRDLTDSTVIRNIGLPFSYILIATQSLMKGLNKLVLNESAIRRDLENNWAVVAEAIQTILRREGYPAPYETLKALTRTNEVITEQTIHDFIDSLQVSEEVKNELRKISPFSYTGI